MTTNEGITSTISKSVMSATKETLTMEIGISKYNKSKRIVAGFATLDNTDIQGDVVGLDASIEAFKNSRMNLREMHGHKAVGKILKYEPRDYVAEDGESYRGVYVETYVSLGAEDTWQKVLDGTLKAFSVKGPIRDYEFEMRKGSDGRDQPVRIIKAYELEELSLVDAGGNQYANVVSIQKNASGEIENVSGIASEITLHNVFWCEKDNKYGTSELESKACPEGHDMSKIGWYEVFGEDGVEKLNEIVKTNQALHPNIDNITKEGVVTVAETETTDSVVEETPATETAETEEVVAAETSGEVAAEGEETEESADAPSEVEDDQQDEEVSEVEDDADEIVKIHNMVAQLEGKVEKGLQENREEIKRAIETMEKSLKDSQAEHIKKMAEFDQKFGEISKSVEGFDGKLDEVSESISKIDAATVITKSNDREDQGRGGTNSVWDGLNL